MQNFLRFLMHVLRLRSVSRPRWVQEYENHKPRYKQ